MPIDFQIVDQVVARIVIDRPERHNALDVAHDRALAEAWQRYNDDPRLRVAILSGAGRQAFCTGADIHDYLPHRQAMAASPAPASIVSFGGLTGFRDVVKPTIAAIDGFCVAGGLELALACDIRIASFDARFGLPEVKLGILPGGGGTQRLARVVGLGVAMQMVLTGDTVDASFALARGLVSTLVDSDALHPTALAIARRIAANAPLAVGAARHAVRMSQDCGLEEGLLQEAQLQRQLLRTEDACEGVAAFSQRRAPIYAGR